VLAPLIVSDAETLLRDTAGLRSLAGRRSVRIVLVASPVYGLAMGSFSVDALGRVAFAVLSAVKLPFLILVSAAVCVPGFFVINAAAGLRDDFRESLRAIAAAQAAVALALCSFAPLVLVLYSGLESHRIALIWNMLAFTAAAVIGQIVMLRRYRPLIRRNTRHRSMLVVWLVMYAFVGVQMGWSLRPFVGTPGTPVQVFRDGAFTNAYVAVWRTVVGGE
jgi:hypothetical protein